jgi:hypothetical protein
MYSESLVMRQRLADSDPEDTLARGRVGYVHTRLANLARTRDRLESAAVHAQTAITIQERIVALSNDASSRRELAAALHELGLIEAARGKSDRGCDLHRRSLKLFDSAPRMAHFDTVHSSAFEAVARCDR